MAVAYQAVQWNRQKRIYDLVLSAGMGAFLAVFAGCTKALFPWITDEILLIRSFGAAAFLLLHVILCIGPLCRLRPEFLPLLYNRRHAGVLMALLSLVHAGLVIITYHGGGDTSPILSIFVSDPSRGSPLGIPFQPLGFVALVILVLMAATSHDFWLANLGAPVWKALHMLVYAAYALLVLHVALGVLQAEQSPGYVAAVAAGFATVLGLHVVAGLRERPNDRDPGTKSSEEFVEVCGVDEIPEKRARIVCLTGERVAIFRHDGRISAVSNVCQHQNGPLGEGRIMDGCITCPWHGYQYVPETGASPPPFTEKVPTFNVRVKNGRVFVHPRPNAPGTCVAPTRTESAGQTPGGEFFHSGMSDEFYIGWKEKAPERTARIIRFLALVLVALMTMAGGLLAFPQSLIGRSVFEWGKVREFSGILEANPVPHLIGRRGATNQFYYLVRPWKFGFDPRLAAELDGRQVTLRGTLIYRDDQAMIEVEHGTVLPAAGHEAAGPPDREPQSVVSLGEQTFVGEIVDSKCFLGVMNPGQLKPHRACAVRCISGGVPPVLLVRGTDGAARYFLLVSRDDKPVNKRVLALVAEPVRITGEVLRQDGMLVLRADPSTYQLIR